jgi:hypothetical protein
MAKRKRASLKDKSPETLGRTPKKGKGVDLLFGGPVGADTGTGVENQPSDSSSAANTGVEVSGAVDELGLPVAMEAPPDDLVLASEAVAGSTTAGEADAVNPEVSPFSMPAVSDTPMPPADVNDLSGLVVDDAPEFEEDKLANSGYENDLTGLVNSGSGVTPADDLSGLVVDSDLSGLVMDDPNDTSGMLPGVPAADIGGTGLGADDTLITPETSVVPGAPVVPAVPADSPPPATFSPPENDLSGLVADEDLSGLAVEETGTFDQDMSMPAPTTAAPVTVPSTPAFDPGPISVAMAPELGGQPTYSDSTPGYDMPYEPEPAPDIPPPSTATGAPNLSPPRPSSFEMDALSSETVQTLSAFGEVLPDDPTEFLPQDELPDSQLTVREVDLVEMDQAKQEEVLAFLGTRPTELFEEIEQLHDDVADQLSGNKTDVSFALDTLLDANNIVIERPYQYEEALYRVALVRTMLNRRRKLSRASYGGTGFFVLFYGIISVFLAIWGIFFGLSSPFVNSLPAGELGFVFQAIFMSGMAGLLGGAVEILWRLYYRVSIKQDFDPQYLMYYIVKPILGFVLGLIMYFLVAVGTTITASTNVAGETTLPMVEATTGFVLTMLLGFVAGYRQESVFDMIYVLIKRISPEAAKTEPKSLKPIDDVPDTFDGSGIKV